MIQTNTMAFIIFLLTISSASYGNSFWNEQKKGANFFNKLPTKDRFITAKNAGIKFVRLTPSKWTSSKKDFLIGDAHNYEGLVAPDLKRLKEVLSWADDVEMKVVLTFLTLPGTRWAQHNGNKYDTRLFKDFRYHEDFAKFWKDLANELKNEKSIVGYDIINEPAPEKAVKLDDWYSGDYTKWYDATRNTPADLNLLFKKALSAIREVDSKTAVILETGFYGTPWGIKYLAAVEDPNLLYSFHMYEPYQYTNYRNRVFKYPGKSPIGETEEYIVHWDKEALKDFFKPVIDWQSRNKISHNKILVGEFGVYRRHIGSEIYLKDLISLFNSKDFGWHWAFYSYREDTWAGMDFELGKKSLPWTWWEQHENGENPPRPYSMNPLWRTILTGLK